MGLVLLASLMLKSGHHLLLHHDHGTKPACHTDHTGSSTHLHDERYNPDDCSICTFHFGASEPAPIPVLLLKQQAYTQACPLPPATPHLTDTGYSTLLRGPPVWSHSV
ncbi:MAG: hypothetical protein JNJ90_13265 [Saprospiraceae bacterium]|nr:hypothetical protein [Saprospiraceae bacterium]